MLLKPLHVTVVVIVGHSYNAINNTYGHALSNAKETKSFLLREQ